MRAMCVRDRDPLQVPRALPELPDRVEHQPAVALEQRVDERELAAVVEEERVDVTALPVAEAVDAGPYLSHDLAPAARFHGANGFATPSRAGSSSGKCRSSSDRIVLFSTQSRPSCV